MGLKTDGARPTALTFRRCPAAGFADAKIDMAIANESRAASKAGRLTFTNAAERSIALPISFRGLAEALGALDKAAPSH